MVIAVVTAVRASLDHRLANHNFKQLVVKLTTLLLGWDGNNLMFSVVGAIIKDVLLSETDRSAVSIIVPTHVEDVKN